MATWGAPWEQMSGMDGESVLFTDGIIPVQLEDTAPPTSPRAPPWRRGGALLLNPGDGTHDYSPSPQGGHTMGPSAEPHGQTLGWSLMTLWFVLTMG